MKKYAVLLALNLLFATPAHAASPAWQDFIDGQDHGSYVKLRTALSTGKKDCASKLPDATQTGQLFTLVEIGNADAFAALMLVSQCLSAGDLEHFYRSSGVFVEKAPEAFLQIVTAYAVSDQELPFMLTLSPPDGKEGNATPDELDKRMAAIQSVKENTTLETQKHALLMLQKARSDIAPVDVGIPK